jgi:hypothetical protein
MHVKVEGSDAGRGFTQRLGAWSTPTTAFRLPAHQTQLLQRLVRPKLHLKLYSYVSGCRYIWDLALTVARIDIQQHGK